MTKKPNNRPTKLYINIYSLLNLGWLVLPWNGPVFYPFKKKLGTITTWLMYKRQYQHLFLIGCWHQIIRALSIFFFVFLLEVQNIIRCSRFVLCTSGSNKPTRVQQSEGVRCGKTETPKNLRMYTTALLCISPHTHTHTHIYIYIYIYIYIFE